METERIALSQRERERLKVLHEVKQKHLTQAEAAQRLKVTDRQVRRLLLALKERGDGAVVHGLRGRPSNRKLDASFEQRILARVRQRYVDFGPTLAAEHLAKEGWTVSRETLRKWMTRVHLWRPRIQRVKVIHVWRERRSCFGEMVMQDSSPFRWLEERGPACQLIAVIDDATSRLWARLVEHDTTEEKLHYTDKNSIFRHRSGATALQETAVRRRSAFAVRTCVARTGNRMDCGPQSAGERARPPAAFPVTSNIALICFAGECKTGQFRSLLSPIPTLYACAVRTG